MANKPKPPLVLDLTWEGELTFAGRSGDTSIVMDSRSKAGPSPMQALAFGLAGCMAIDVVNILVKGRHPLGTLSARLVGTRAPEPPTRFVTIGLHFRIGGAVPAEAIDRAIQLSRDRYCSVWNSLRQDIDFTVTYERAAV